MSSTPPTTESPTLILYATVTGQSEDVAKELQKRCQLAYPKQTFELLSTEQLMAKPNHLDQLPSLTLLVCVISTTGNGEEPDMARKFFRELRKKGKDFLRNVQVILCALGDSNYSQFCEAGMKLRRLLMTAGVSELMPMTKIDEVTAEADLPNFFDQFEKLIKDKKEVFESKAPLAQTEASTSNGDTTTVAPTVPVPAPAPVASPVESSTPVTVTSSADVTVSVPSPLTITTTSSDSSLSATIVPVVETTTVIASTTVPSPAPEVVSNKENHDHHNNVNANAANCTIVAPVPVPVSTTTTSSVTSHAPPSLPTSISVPLNISELALTPSASISVPLSATSDASPSPAVMNTPAVSSTPVSDPSATPTTTVSKKDKELQIVWIEHASPYDVPPPSLGRELPAYYKRRWGNLDAHGERSCWGTEAESPAFATLHGARYLTTPESHDAGRMVVHMELEVPRGYHSFTYKPGDSVGIYCANDRAIVESLLARLALAPSEYTRQFAHDRSTDPAWRHLPSPCSLMDAFLYALDITASKSWKKAFFASLGRACTDASDRRALLAIGGRDEHDKLLKSVRGVKSPYEIEILGKSPTLIDLLRTYPSCQPSLETLLTGLTPLLPRSYSLSSAQLHDAGIMSIAWSKVEYDSPDYGHREGVCTKWMQQLCQTAGFLTDKNSQATVAGTSLSSSLSGSSSASSAFFSVALPSPTFHGALRQKADGRYQIPVFRKHSAFFALPEDTCVTSSNCGTGLARPVSVPTSLSSLGSLPSISIDARLHRPLIMIGPGTGVAPFRGFLQQRAAHKRAVEADADAGCDGEWRTLEHLAPSKKSDRHERTKPCALRPPIDNTNGAIVSPAVTRNGGALIPATVVQPVVSAPTNITATAAPKKARGHYDTPDVVFDDTPESDGYGRFGEESGPTVSSPGGTSKSSSLSSSSLKCSSSKSPIGPMYLYFGCRRADWDYLYSNDFAQFVEDDVLTQFSVAFSRHPSNPDATKFYVQQRLKSDGQLIADLLLKHDAYLYVCGDGVRMAADVGRCIKEILQEFGGKSPIEADQLILHWKNRHGKEPTYIEDIWA